MTATTLTNGTTIGKAKVIVDIIKKGNAEIRPGTIIKPTFITIHNTGNTGRGANAKAHNTLIHNLASYDPKDTTHKSWHFTVDENYIYQHLPLNENAWHCGDGSGKKSGNMTSIGIEICHHVDQKDYAQAEANAVALTKYLCLMLQIGIAKGVVPHQHWSGKFCPSVILTRDKSLAKFIAAVSSYSNNASAAAPAKLWYLRSGTYATKTQAQVAMLKVSGLGIASAEWMRLIPTSDGKFYWETGTYNTEENAKAARKKVIDNKIAWVVDIKLK